VLAASTLDPERLIWRLGAKTISIPAPLKIPMRELVFFDEGVFHARLETAWEENGNVNIRGVHWVSQTLDIDSLHRQDAISWLRDQLPPRHYEPIELTMIGYKDGVERFYEI
jgi:hypothetical protein